MILKVITKCFIRRCSPISLLKRVNQFEYQLESKILQQPRRLFSSDDSGNIDLDSVYNAKFELYQDCEDPVIASIKKFATLDEITSFLENDSNLQKEHLCQLTATLWDSSKQIQIPKSILDSIATKLEPVLDDLTVIEACCTFHTLNRLGLSIKHPSMERMNDFVLQGIKTDSNIPLHLLTKFTNSINSEKGLYSSYLAVATLPILSSRLDTCNNADDLFHIVDSLNNISQVLSNDFLDILKVKVNQFLDEGILNETTLPTLLKIINFLNYPHWSYRNTLLIRRLLLELEENIPFLKTRQLMTISRAFQSQVESARLVPHLVKRAQQLLKEEPSVELLSLAVLNVTPDQREQIAEKLRQFLSAYQISSTQSGDTLQMVFKIIRLLKISDVEMCDQYWSKSLSEIYGTKEQNVVYKLTRHIHKYMFFNNNLGGTYRHKEFESSMLEMIQNELKKTLIPKDFATFASFVIAYSSSKGIPPSIVEKIEELYEQFTVKDCLQISRGVQILSETSPKHTRSLEMLAQLDIIDIFLRKCGEIHINSEDLHISQLNGIIRSHNNRKSSKGNSLFNKLIYLYDSPDQHHQLNSRSIREICYNLTLCNFKIDSMCDRFIDYIIGNHEHVTGDTVEKILSCCYNFSYFPENVEVFDRSSEIIVRDFNYMNGLSIVQSLLALIFYKSCPQQLIAMVFSGEFIKRLEQEIAMCYSKNSYPQRIMNQVMQLNRAVCLDCPEVNVKWFQQSFMEAQASKGPTFSSRVQGDITKLLLGIVKKPEYLMMNRVTPYGYRVDFEVTIDQYNRFVHPLPEDYVNANYNPNLNRIAILLLRNHVLCDNDINRIKGSELLRMRHLEMMGYRVIHVKMHEFNSLYANISAKIKYLKDLLQLSA